MDDEQLLRYSRHLLLEEMGVGTQQKLLDAHALIIGAGGLGCPAALYLGSAGVGLITVVDDDTVELSNLQRQIAHHIGSIGQTKVASVAHAIHRVNPTIHVQALAQRADDAWLGDHVARATVVLDCSDNFATRHAINRACVRHGKPLVSGAAVQFDAQISVFDMRNERCPCYACMFAPDLQLPESRCATLGVFAPLTGIIGCMQAAEAIKLVAGVGTSLAGRLLMLDARAMVWTDIKVDRDPHCKVCAAPLSRRN